VRLCVVSAGHTREPCINGWTDRDANWRVYRLKSGGPKKPHIRRRLRSPAGRDNFRGCLTHSKVLGVSAASLYMAKAITVTAELRQPLAVLQTGRGVTLHNPHPCDAAFRQNYWPLVTICSTLAAKCNSVVSTNLQGISHFKSDAHCMTIYWSNIQW